MLDATHSPIWKDLLTAGFGVEHVTTKKGCEESSIDWTIFRKATFSIAYPFFPMGLARLSEIHHDHLCSHLEKLKDKKIDLTRFVLHEPTIPSLAKRASNELLPVTYIPDLKNWTLGQVSKDCRMKLKKAERAGLLARPANTKDDSTIHKLYENSVRRHRGTVRYPKRYFSALIQASSKSDAIFIRIVELRDEPAGFIATLLHQKTSYYLHGGYSDHARHLRPGYFSMSQAIEHAQNSGCETFDMLASPSRQPSLVRFKECFGGKTILCRPIDIPLSRKGILLSGILKVLR